MTDVASPILVFGATGRQGGSVCKALIDPRRTVRAIVRKASSPSAAMLRELGFETAQASLDDIDAIRAAMKDVHGVFCVLPGGLPDGDEVRLGCAIADAAAASGVEYFVYSSGASAGDKLTGVPRFDAKPRIEAHVRELPIVATIVRPMIFMEMLLHPNYGLDQCRFSFFVHRDQEMQLVAVDDIGRLVAGIFADEARFGGQTIKLASDTVTGRELEAAFSEAIGGPITYSRFSDEILANSPAFAHMAESLRTGPLSQFADLSLMRELNPQILTLRAWLGGSGRDALLALLGGRGAK